MDVFKTLIHSQPGAVGSNVAITGGSVNGTNIGATTPGTGAFTTVTVNSSLSPSSFGRVISGTTNAGVPAFFGTDGTSSSFAVDFPSSNVTRVRTNGGSEALAVGIATTEVARFSTGQNYLIGGTTDIAGTGGIKTFGTTASTTTTTGCGQFAGGVGVGGAVNVGTYYGMVDGVTAPGATVGYAKIYVDTADGDLKVIFGDGTIKTIATDT